MLFRSVGILTVDYQWPFWGAFALSGFTAAALGFFVGIVSLRLRGHFFSIFTMCVGYIMYLVIEKWESLTHGTVGIIGIPAPGAIAGIAFDTPRALYYLVFVFLVLGVWVMSRIVRSLMPSTCAVSISVSPAKNRQSTSRASSGSNVASPVTTAAGSSTVWLATATAIGARASGLATSTSAWSASSWEMSGPTTRVGSSSGRAAGSLWPARRRA